MKESIETYYIEVLKKKYSEFDGRASRKQYWMFVLFTSIVNIILSILDSSLGTEFGQARDGILVTIYSVLVFVPYLAISIRRMHDSNHSGWWIICPIVNLVFFLFDSTPGDNKYGPNPKGVPAVPVTPTA